MSLEGKKQAYKLCEAEFDAEMQVSGSVGLVNGTAFQGAADQYIDVLEEHINMLWARVAKLQTQHIKPYQQTGAKPNDE